MALSIVYNDPEGGGDSGGGDGGGGEAEGEADAEADDAGIDDEGGGGDGMKSPIIVRVYLNILSRSFAGSTEGESVKIGETGCVSSIGSVILFSENNFL